MNKLPLRSGLSLLTIGLLTAALQPTPALANPVIIYYPPQHYPVYQNYGNWIYGSPIPAPMPVNPYTGTAIYPYNSNVQIIRQSVRHRDNRLIDNSVLIDPRFRHSERSYPAILYPRIDRDPYSDGYLREYDGYGGRYYRRY